MNCSVDGFLPYEATDIADPSLQPNLKEINETPETRAKCLEILRKELKRLQDIEPCLEDNFLLRFLRVSKFNTDKAFQRIQKYYKQQDILLDAFKKVSMSLNKAKNMNYCLYSPYRLKNNSSLLIALGGNVDYSKYTYAERFYLDILSINKALEHPLNQIAGVTLIFDFKGFNTQSLLAHTLGWNKIFVETFLNAYPGRIKAAHFVNTPSLFLAILRMVWPFFPKKIKERVFMHPNDGWKSLHAAIPPEILPEVYGGKLKRDFFIDPLQNIEELEVSFQKVFRYGYIQTKKRRETLSPIYKHEVNIHCH